MPSPHTAGRASASAAALLLLLAPTAMAGGFDRGGIDLDLLFDARSFAFETSVTFVAPQRTIEGIERGVNLTAPGIAPGLTTGSIDVEGGYLVPQVSAKVGLGRHVDCLGTFTQPFGADAFFGTNNAYSATSVEFKIDTTDLGVTCSAGFGLGETALGPARLRFIAGGSYLKLSAFQSRQTFADFLDVPAVALPPGLTGLDPEALGLFTLDDTAIGWRAGLAFEIPEAALRATIIYSSSYDLDLSGTVDISAFGTPAATVIGTAPVSASTEIPQSVELALQSGINDRTLLFGSFKWQEWSRLGAIPIEGVLSPASGLPTFTAFEPLYRDGITASVGVGRRLTERLGGQLSFTYDRGTSTIAGTQTDTYLVSGGLNYQIGPEVDITLGGGLGILTGGSSADTGGDPANNLSYSFGTDLIYAVTGGLKIGF